MNQTPASPAGPATEPQPLTLEESKVPRLPSTHNSPPGNHNHTRDTTVLPESEQHPLPSATVEKSGTGVRSTLDLLCVEP